MNNHIKLLFVSGLCALALGWSFFVYKTNSDLKMTKARSFEIKSDLIELRWGQIMNRPVKFGLGEGPEVFNVELAALDKTILGSEMRPKYQNVNPSLVKSAYLDAGVGASFFTTEIDGETFFVKVQDSDGNTMLQGYTYAYILNLLSVGLKDTDWYFINNKNQIVFSHEASYLGKAKNFIASVSKTIRSGKARYSIQMVDRNPVQSAGIMWLGLLGLFLIGAANFPSLIPQQVSRTASPGKQASKTVSPEKEAVAEDVKKDLDEVIEEQAAIEIEEEIVAPIEPVAAATEDAENFVAVELTSEEESASKETDFGYSEFLTENPSLSMEMPAIPNKKIIETDVKATAEVPKAAEAVELKEEGVATEEVMMNEEKVVSNEPARSGSDWIKLAEELSANLEKFADEWKEEKPAPNSAPESKV